MNTIFDHAKMQITNKKYNSCKKLQSDLTKLYEWNHEKAFGIKCSEISCSEIWKA